MQAAEDVCANNEVAGRADAEFIGNTVSLHAK
jgi:hypothetical protein